MVGDVPRRVVIALRNGSVDARRQAATGSAPSKVLSNANNSVTASSSHHNARLKVHGLPAFGQHGEPGMADHAHAPSLWYNARRPALPCPAWRRRSLSTAYGCSSPSSIARRARAGAAARDAHRYHAVGVAGETALITIPQWVRSRRQIAVTRTEKRPLHWRFWSFHSGRSQRRCRGRRAAIVEQVFVAMCREDTQVAKGQKWCRSSAYDLRSARTDGWRRRPRRPKRRQFPVRWPPIRYYSPATVPDQKVLSLR